MSSMKWKSTFSFHKKRSKLSKICLDELQSSIKLPPNRRQWLVLINDVTVYQSKLNLETNICLFLNSLTIIKKWAMPGLFLFYFRLFNTVDSKCSINFCRWLDSNRGPLELEATALPTAPQPLPLPYYYKGMLLTDVNSELNNRPMF